MYVLYTVYNVYGHIAVGVYATYLLHYHQGKPLYTIHHLVIS